MIISPWRKSLSVNMLVSKQQVIELIPHKKLPVETIISYMCKER